MSEESKIVSVIKSVMPAVVSIIIEKKLEDVEKENQRELYSFLPGHKNVANHKSKIKIPDFLVDSHGMVDIGGGSGFIVEKDGVIMTNKHVISDPKATYTVIMNDGKEYSASVMSRDPINDVAILRVAAENLPTVPLADNKKLELGQSVIAIGNALGIFKNTVSMGIISGLSRSITAQEDKNAPPQELRGMIQTDAAINPGNSGGPLVDIEGRAIGVNAAIIFGAQNIGFAIPIKAAKRDLSDLKKYGRVRRPFLGVRYLLVNNDLQEHMNLPVDFGAIVVSESPHDFGVAPGSPAEKIGIKIGDIILEMNGLRVDTEHSIQDYLDEMNVGDELAVTVRRQEKEIKMKTILAERI